MTVPKEVRERVTRIEQSMDEAVLHSSESLHEWMRVIQGQPPPVLWVECPRADWLWMIAMAAYTQSEARSLRAGLVRVLRVYVARLTLNKELPTGMIDALDRHSTGGAPDADLLAAMARFGTFAKLQSAACNGRTEALTITESFDTKVYLAVMCLLQTAFAKTRNEALNFGAKLLMALAQSESDWRAIMEGRGSEKPRSAEDASPDEDDRLLEGHRILADLFRVEVAIPQMLVQQSTKPVDFSWMGSDSRAN